MVFISSHLKRKDPLASFEWPVALQILFDESGTWTFALQPRDAVTVVRITEDGEVCNPVFRFVSRFIIGHTRSLDAYLQALGKATGQTVDVED